jgi:hypothetical protein
MHRADFFFGKGALARAVETGDSQSLKTLRYLFALVAIDDVDLLQ